MLRNFKSPGALIAAALLGLPVTAQRVQLRDALPQGTIVYVGAPDLKASIQEAMSMPLMRMWHEAEVQDFFAEALKMLDAEWQKGLEKAREAHKQGELPFHPDEILKLRLAGGGFALTSLDMTTAENEPVPHVGAILHLEFGDSAPAWRQLIEFGLKAAVEESHGELRREDSKVGEIALVTLVPPMTDMSINVAFVGSGVVFGSVKGEVQRLIENTVAGKRDLSASEAFVATFKNLDTQGAEIEGYVQPGPLFDWVHKTLNVLAQSVPDFPAELDVDGIARAIDALGARSIKGTGFTSSYQPNPASKGNKSVSKSFLHAPAPQRKGLLAGGTKELNMDFLKWVPKDVASFSAMTFHLSTYWEALVGALKAYDEKKSKQILGMLAMYEQQFGINVRDDLLAVFGNEVITWSMPMAALGTTPEMAILIQVKDQDKLLKTLNTVAQLSDGAFQIDESDRQGVKMYQIQINIDPTGGGGFNPLDMISPTFGFKNGYLVGGLSTGDVKRAFKRMDEDNAATDVRSNADFKPYLEILPKQGLSAVSFSDWKAQFEGYYNLVTSLAAFVPVDDNIPIDLSLMPDVATLTKHLFGAVSWTTTDANGYHTFAQGPWGPETVALFAGGVAAGTAAFAGMRGSARIRR